MKGSPLVTAALALALFVSPAAAQLYEGPPLDEHEYLQFVGAGDESGTEVATWGGVYIGPYSGYFTTPTTPAFSLYCVDYSHYAKSQWVDVTRLADDASFASTRYGDFATYQRTAYLSSLFNSWQDLGTDRRTVWSGIHAAIWSITNGENLGWNETAAIRDALLWSDDHIAAAASFDTDGWYILSPDAYYGRDGQEFLIRAPSTVPEPSTYLLMGTGLLLLGVVGWKRRSASLVEEA